MNRYLLTAMAMLASIAGFSQTSATQISSISVVKAIPVNTDSAEYFYQKGLLEKQNGRKMEAYKNLGSRDAELIENYAFLSSVFDANYKEALPVLAKAVQGGKHEKRYIEQVRKGYLKLNPGKDVESYIASLEKEFIDKLREEPVMKSARILDIWPSS